MARVKTKEAELLDALADFRRELIRGLKNTDGFIGIPEEPPTVCLVVAIGRIRALEEKVRRLEGK